MNIAPIAVKWTVDTTGLDKAKNATDSFGKNLGTRFSGFGKNAGLLMGAALATGITVAARAGLAAFSGAVEAASQYGETLGATAAIFGEEMTPALTEWADKASTAFGASKTEALDAAKMFGVYGKDAGLSGEKLVGFAKNLSQLGGDLGAFYGGSTADAVTAITGALRGENEAIRKYGVNINDAAVKQKAFDVGITKSIKDTLTPQQKTLATTALIMDKTAIAQGNYADTSQDLAQQQKTMKAEMANARIEMGDELLPIQLELTKAFLDALPALKDALIPAIKDLAGSFKKDLLPAIVAAIPMVSALLAFLATNIDKIIAFGGAIGGLVVAVKAMTLATQIQNVVFKGSPWGLIISLVVTLVAYLVDLGIRTGFFATAWETMSKVVGDAAAAIGTWIGEMWANVTGFFTGVGEFLGGFGESLYSFATDAWGMYINGMLDVLFTLPSLVADILSKIPGLEQFGGDLKASIDTVKGTVAGAVGVARPGAAGKAGNATGSSVVNQTYNVTAQGLTVAQVQKDATRKANLAAPTRSSR